MSDLYVVPEECGLGDADRTCAYLVMAPAGWFCGRAEPSIKAEIDARLAEGTMNAKIAPTAEYPECQTERERMAEGA